MRRISIVTVWLATAALADTVLIAWRDIGLVRSATPDSPPVVLPLAAQTAGALTGVKVDRVAVEPAVLDVAVGGRVCISQFDIAAYAGDERTAAVPLIVAMQVDHLQQLKMEAKPQDLCFRPQSAGEYAIRFTSKLPAADSTFRGAQVFVRVG